MLIIELMMPDFPANPRHGVKPVKLGERQLASGNRISGGICFSLCFHSCLAVRRAYQNTFTSYSFNFLLVACPSPPF
jgi:hypothetical protein